MEKGEFYAGMMVASPFMLVGGGARFVIFGSLGNMYLSISSLGLMNAGMLAFAFGHVLLSTMPPQKLKSIISVSRNYIEN